MDGEDYDLVKAVIDSQLMFLYNVLPHSLGLIILKIGHRLP